MGNVNTGYIERVRYTLHHELYGSLVIKEPEGWKSDEKEIARNEEYDGIFPKFSNALKFIGSAKDYLYTIYELYDINAEVRLVKDEKDPETDLWERSYDGYLDFSTYENENNKISLKFNSGGVEQMIKSRESDPFEIDRETTVDGKTMSPLKTNTVQLDGRKIFLKTLYGIKGLENYGTMFIESNAGNTRHQTVGVPLKLISKSHEEAQDVTVETNGNRDQGSVGMMFFLNSEVARSLKIKLNLTFVVSNVDEGHLDYANFSCAITRYSGADLNESTRTNLFFATEHEIRNYLEGAVHTVNFDNTINLGIGDSLALEFLTLADFRLDAHAELRISVGNMTGKLSIEEDSFFEKSTSKFILAHELLDRLCEITTNRQKAFYSKFFGRTDLGYSQNGPGAFVGLTHGFWIRGFDKVPVVVNNDPEFLNDNYEDDRIAFKPLTTSFKDALTSFATTHNVGFGIEKIGFKERVVVEDKKYFYNRNVTIKLPNQVKKVKRTPALKYCYSSIEIGYEKGGSYEEAMGLDEYNGRSYFTTILKPKQPLTLISKYRADSYGKEFARRKPKFKYPTQDTQYDEDIFIMDLKPSPFGTYFERKWADDFLQAPSGTYDPETSTNLRLSPFNLLLKHGWVIAAGLTKFATDYIRYASSTANSKLKTKLFGGNEYAENGNILNSELQPARYVAQFVEFEHQVDFKLMQKVEGTTIINGETIHNVYGQIEFRNENGDIERGWLMSLKPNDKGKWKVLKFNR